MLNRNRVQNFQSTQKMKFTKTETEYNMKSIRFLLLTITTMFIVLSHFFLYLMGLLLSELTQKELIRSSFKKNQIIIAGLMIVLGISVYSHYHSFSYFFEGAKGGSFFTPSIMSIFLGMVLLVVTSFGFFGSLKQSTCLVNLYALILAVILIVKLVVVILAFTVSPSQIMRYIDIPVWEYTTEPEIQDEIDMLQVSLNCCGSTSYQDYMYMDFPANSSTVSVNREVDGQPTTITVPSSCCAVPGDYVCTKLRSTSCKEALVNLIVQNSSVLGVLGVSVMFIQLLGVVFALLLARCIRKLKSERAFMSWKAKEQMILAREEAKAKQAVFINQSESSIA